MVTRTEIIKEFELFGKVKLCSIFKNEIFVTKIAFIHYEDKDQAT